jgi:hypothetical protein
MCLASVCPDPPCVSEFYNTQIDEMPLNVACASTPIFPRICLTLLQRSYLDSRTLAACHDTSRPSDHTKYDSVSADSCRRKGKISPTLESIFYYTSVVRTNNVMKHIDLD